MSAARMYPSMLTGYAIISSRPSGKFRWNRPENRDNEGQFCPRGDTGDKTHPAVSENATPGNFSLFLFPPFVDVELHLFPWLRKLM